MIGENKIICEFGVNSIKTCFHIGFEVLCFSLNYCASKLFNSSLYIKNLFELYLGKHRRFFLYFHKLCLCFHPIFFLFLDNFQLSQRVHIQLRPSVVKFFGNFLPGK
jgi:hypothetical protein